MPADTPMVVVPREPTEAMIEAGWEAKRAAIVVADPADIYHAMLSSSPVGEGLGALQAQAPSVPTEQVGGPVVALRPDDFDEHGFARTPLACMAVAARTLRSIPAFGGDGEAVVWCVSDDVPESIAVALSYIDAAIKELSAPSTTSTAEQVGTEADRLMQDFYLSADYDPKAARPADTVKAAIAFALRTRPTPATPEGLREKVLIADVIRDDRATELPIFLDALEEWGCDDTTDQAKAILRFLSSEVGVSQWREDDAHG